MGKLKVLDLFSGIGGFSLGLERTGGFETVAFCEIDPFCQMILKKHWPEVEIYPDVTRLKYRKNVDLVTAGFPCQDISYAGHGAGLTGERSGLFWYIIRTLCMVGRPAALLENVAALLNRGMGDILGALAAFGYDTEWHCIPASYVCAPHLRDRLWLYTHPERCGLPSGVFQRAGQAAIKSAAMVREGYEHTKWATWNCSPELPLLAYGLSEKLDEPATVALGNSVVPQIPEIIGHAILQAEGITE